MGTTIPHLLHHTFEQHQEREVILLKRAGMYLGYTYWQLWETVRRLTHGMAARGIGEGDVLAIVSENRPEWVYIDYAAFFLKAVVLPLDPTADPLEIAAQLKKHKSRAVFIGSMDFYQGLKKFGEDLPQLEFFFPFDTTRSDPSSKTEFFRQLTAMGEKHRKKQPDFFRLALEGVTRRTPASFWPGRDAVLSQGELNGMINAAADQMHLGSDDVLMSAVNLSDPLERVMGNWLAMRAGCTIAYARGEGHLLEDLREIRPTLMINYAKKMDELLRTVQSGAEQKRGFLGLGGSATRRLGEVLGGRLKRVAVAGDLRQESSRILNDLGVSVVRVTVPDPPDNP